MTGGYVTSWASSTLDFDLVTECRLSGVATKDDAVGIMGFDPYLGAHQLIQRIVVTVGGNIIEDFENYPQIYKCMKAMHGNQERRFLDSLESAEQTSIISKNWKANQQAFYTEDGLCVYPVSHAGPRATASTDYTSDEVRTRVRLNLMSCLGSLSGAKYWPNVLLNSDVRLEIYLNEAARGMIVPPPASAVTGSVADTAGGFGTWSLENVQFTLSNVRLNTQVINALKSTSGVQMIMPGFTVQQNTLPTNGSTSTITTILKYQSSASILKSLLLVFRSQEEIGQAGFNSYNFLEPMGLTHKFLIGSTLMPARPVTNVRDRFRELQRCIGGPANSCDQKTLLRLPNYLHPRSKDTALNRGTRVLGLATDSDRTTESVVACHILGQSLEMYADHTLSSIVFSGINAVNLIMQAQLKITGTNKIEGDEDLRPGTSWDNYVPYQVDTIMVHDRLLEFKNGEVVMGY